MIDTLILPGYGNSGPKHWQSLWEKKDPSFLRVQLGHWENPNCSDWVKVLDHAINQSKNQLILVAHSLACLIIPAWAEHSTRKNHEKIRGAFLVAPPDPVGGIFPESALGFSTVTLKVLPFPSLVVASTNDPYATPHFSRTCARAWGGGFTLVGDKGHINSDSGLDMWDEGQKLLEAFTLL